MSDGSVPFRVPPYEGQISQRFAAADFLSGLADLEQRFHSPDAVLHVGANQVVMLRAVCDGHPVCLAVKAYGTASFLADRGVKRIGSRARRSWHGACLLRDSELGTPEPIAFLERWDGGRLREAYYLSVYEPGMVRLSMELERVMQEEPNVEGLARLVEAAARSVAELHRAGILHGRLHDANLLLRPLPGAAQFEVQFTGLHQAQRKQELNLRDRARDAASLSLPTRAWKWFIAGYFGGEAPQEFESALRRGRRRAKTTDSSDYAPADEADGEGWLWESADAAASDTPTSPAPASACPIERGAPPYGGPSGPRLSERYAAAYRECFQHPVSMIGRIGISVEPDMDHQDRELEWLAVLGKSPVLVRLYCHRGPSHWERVIGLVERMSSIGRAVGIALVQDRQSVVAPQTWDRFVATVMDRLHADVDWVELGHAVDDPAWGITGLNEYRRMLKLLPWLRNQYPSVRFMGPATSQWDLEFAQAAARQFPDGAPWKAWSTHLNLRHDIQPEAVDDEVGLDLLERCAWLRALAGQSAGCAERLIVSEASYSLRSVFAPKRPGRPSQAMPDAHGLSELTYAQFMIRYLLIAICSGMVERVYWWRLVAARYGLVDDTEEERWRARPAFRMLSCFLQTVGRSTYMARRIDEDRRYYLFKTPQREALVLAYTTLAERKTKIEFPVRGVFNAYGEEQPLIQDACILTGSPLYFSGVQDIQWFRQTEAMACQQRA